MLADLTGIGRPSVRPAHQRHPQPSFTFPVTPPSIAIVDTFNHVSKTQQGDCITKEKDDISLQTAQWTPTTSATPVTATGRAMCRPSAHMRPGPHRRALSDSTAHEASNIQEHHQQQRSVVSRASSSNQAIERDEQRLWTMDDLAVITSAPLLNINIPSWRLGTPRFTLRGTPMLRGSSYAPTEELRASTVSGANSSSRRPKPPQLSSDIVRRRPPRLNVQTHQSPPAALEGQPNPPALHLPTASRHPAGTSPQLVVEPSMFTDLTFGPACDDALIVKYSSTKSVTAATPPRLVAEITSPSFLDYELLSDFFLTFRSFLKPADLLRMLVARLRWALDRSDEAGMIVRVRTFVAIRHWILNYFVDDFLPDFDLRVMFCDLLNDFVEELTRGIVSRNVQLKILSELKKCWRRVCAQFWDVPEGGNLNGSNNAIMPGGIAGGRSPDASTCVLSDGLAPEQSESKARQPLSPPSAVAQTSSNLRGEMTKPLPVCDFVVIDNRPGTPEDQTGEQPRQSPTSPHSSVSRDIVSCSFPGKSMKTFSPNIAHWMTAHPAPASTSLAVNARGPIATTPKALIGKRVRPTQIHRRNNSLSDSLRDHCSDKASSSTDQDASAAMQMGGSLVRGNMLPPGQALVKIESAAGQRGQTHRQTTLFRPRDRELASRTRVSGGAMSGYGMRRLLRSVHKVLKTRGQSINTASQPSNLADMHIFEPKGATTNRLPGSAIVPQATPLQPNSSRPAVRIDLLGAEVAEDFKKAVRAEEEEEEKAIAASAQALIAVRQHDSLLPSLLSGSPDAAPTRSAEARRQCSASTVNPISVGVLTQNQEHRPISDMAITIGSKSIVIVDDTTPFEALPAHAVHHADSQSLNTLADSFIRGGADPTPPNTPPSRSLRAGTPRRSSYLLNQHMVMRPVIEQDVLPPFIPDLATLEGSHSTTASENLSRPSISPSTQSNKIAPLSGGTFRMYRSARSPKSPQSFNSILHRRATSLRKTATAPLACRPGPDNIIIEQRPNVPIPAPLRTLRRRPGGNLKDAKHVGDLGQSDLRRSRSVGSLATYTESIQSSFVLSTRPNSAGNQCTSLAYEARARDDVFSLGQLTKPTKRDLSLLSERASKPTMRPSFEAVAQKLALISDDEDDGVESALLKLEGKFPPRRAKLLSIVGQNSELAVRGRNEDPEHRRTLSSGESDFSEISAVQRDIGDLERGSHSGCPDRESSLRQSMVENMCATDTSPHDHDHNQEQGQQEAAQPSVRALSSFLSDGSRDSYCSIPPLQRGLGDETVKSNPRGWAGRSILCGVGDDGDDADDDEEDEFDGSMIEAEQQREDLSFDFVQRTESMERMRPGETAPPAVSRKEIGSFLKDAGADDSDDSLELFHDGSSARDRGVSPCPLPTRSSDGEGANANVKPSTRAHLTMAQALATGPERLDAFAKPETRPRKPLPPTPELSPVMGCTESPQRTAEADRAGEVDQTGADFVSAFASKTVPAVHPKHSVHLPFILAFDSDVLAQQFTLIEKDALTEIDWKELIDMSRKESTSTNPRSWVDFLRNTDAQGVDVVIARFNIMVSWAVSEIVLTQHIEERARCIIKLIHIAAHCRRYRNFATLAQLTFALSRKEVSRLTKTFELVPRSDLKTLHDLERLVTPSRNFHSIREEMETGSDAGCIPFVGIYVHDLLYNAQRPTAIASASTTHNLVNFQRFRCAAAVVKTLLRLMEASTRYTFQPLEGALERCIWIGALSDSDIRACSQNLE